MYAEHNPLSSLPELKKKSPGSSIFVSVILHILIIGVLISFTQSPKAPHTPHKILQATMILQEPMELASDKQTKTQQLDTRDSIDKAETATITPETEVQEQEALEVKHTASEVQSVTSDIKPNIVPVQKPQAPKIEENIIDMPNFDFGDLQHIAKERLLKPQSNMGLLVAKKHMPHSFFSNLPTETEKILTTLQDAELIHIANGAAQDYVAAITSPELIAGPPPLSDEELTAQIIQKSKIDVDCSSTLNQTLAVLSQFTIQAIQCQKNANFQEFIDKRLEKEKKNF